METAMRKKRLFNKQGFYTDKADAIRKAFAKLTGRMMKENPDAGGR